MFVEIDILTIHFELSKRGQPLYKGQDAWSQGVLNMEWRFHCTYTTLNAHSSLVNSIPASLSLVQDH